MAPSAGPYYIASQLNGEYTILLRNPHYNGPRAAPLRRHRPARGSRRRRRRRPGRLPRVGRDQQHVRPRRTGRRRLRRSHRMPRRCTTGWASTSQRCASPSRREQCGQTTVRDWRSGIGDREPPNWANRRRRSVARSTMLHRSGPAPNCRYLRSRTPSTSRTCRTPSAVGARRRLPLASAPTESSGSGIRAVAAPNGTTERQHRITGDALAEAAPNGMSLRLQ